MSRLDTEEGRSMGIPDTNDRFDGEDTGRWKRERDLSTSPSGKKQVTDLRVQLHKRKQARMGDEPSAPQKKRTYLSASPPPTADTEEDLDPVQPFKNRIIVPPGVSKKKGESEESEESPSPPAPRDRRILVRKKSESPVQVSVEVQPKKSTLKNSLTLRLGDKLEAEAQQFTDEEIWAEMMRQKQKKLK